MYSTAFWCLIVVYWLVWLYSVTAVTYTPFIERSEGWSLRSVGVLDQSQQECKQALGFSQCKSLVDVSFPPWHPSCKC